MNEEWIADKARFSYDGLKRQRLSEPMIRGADGQLQTVSWKEALEAVAEAAYQVKPEEMAGIAGKLSDAESMMALKDFLNKMGCERIWCEGDGSSVDADLRSRFLLNTGIAPLEQADVCLLIGTQVDPLANATWMHLFFVIVSLVRCSKGNFICQKVSLVLLTLALSSERICEFYLTEPWGK